VNIYIARTFALLPRSAIQDKALYNKLSQLRFSSEYKGDPQFKLNVDAALAKQAPL
jgi:hypothetical protein